MDKGDEMTAGGEKKTTNLNVNIIFSELKSLTWHNMQLPRHPKRVTVTRNNGEDALGLRTMPLGTAAAAAAVQRAPSVQVMRRQNFTSSSNGLRHQLGH